MRGTAHLTRNPFLADSGDGATILREDASLNASASFCRAIITRATRRPTRETWAGAHFVQQPNQRFGRRTAVAVQLSPDSTNGQRGMTSSSQSRSSGRNEPRRRYTLGPVEAAMSSALKKDGRPTSRTPLGGPARQMQRARHPRGSGRPSPHGARRSRRPRCRGAGAVEDRAIVIDNTRPGACVEHVEEGDSAGPRTGPGAASRPGPQLQQRYVVRQTISRSSSAGWPRSESGSRSRGLESRSLRRRSRRTRQGTARPCTRSASSRGRARRSRRDSR